MFPQWYWTSNIFLRGLVTQLNTLSIDVADEELIKLYDLVYPSDKFSSCWHLTKMEAKMDFFHLGPVGFILFMVHNEI